MKNTALIAITSLFLVLVGAGPASATDEGLATTMASVTGALDASAAMADALVAPLVGLLVVLVALIVGVGLLAGRLLRRRES